MKYNINYFYLFTPFFFDQPTGQTRGWIFMHANRLQLNTSKTEILWCATSRRQHQIPTTAVCVGADTVAPTTSVRDMGIYIDSDLSMRTQVTRTVAGCFAVLRQLRSIRLSVPDPVFQSLVVSLVLTKLDYGNATLTGLPSPAAVGT